jgi:alpha-2-macroglobulin-like protein
MKRPLALLCSATLILPHFAPLLFAPIAQAQGALPPAASCVRRHTHGVGDNAAPLLLESPLETQVLGQRTWLSGGPAALRVIVTDHQTNTPLRADVALTLTPLINGKPDGSPVKLFTGRTGALGTLNAGFVAPAAKPGAYQLTVDVKSSLGPDTVTQPIQLQDSSLLMLTSDKPLYQPGQTMHLRALGMNMATRQALGNTPVTFEIEDARGNKVYKRRDTLSKFGVAGADFTLADEVNMGTFTLRAVLPDGQTEKKVRVERYVLPKYKLSVTTEKPYYLPGQEVKGTVRAAYFFGKPVADGRVDLTINTIDIGVTKLTELHDKTDANGVYAFHYTLPQSFVGQPFEQGKATVGFDVTLKDTADHPQEAHLTVPVVKEPVTVVMVPERAGLVSGLENRVYIAAATPDGAALKNARLTVTATPAVVAGGKPQQPIAPTTLTTDEMGLATYAFSPGNAASVSLSATVTDADGHAAVATKELKAAPTQDGLILRTDKTLAKVGERLDLTALCSHKGGTLYLDVIRNRQTIHTLAQRMDGGRTDITLPLTAEMVGTLELHAYKILPDENIIRDTRVIVVSPANDLDIKLTADRVEYRPGADATLKFAVQDQQHRPVTAALGLAIVDESVFALSELQPGLEKIYFTLEKELMEPKVEIHGLRPTFLLSPEADRFGQPSRQRAAAMLFAATPLREDSGAEDQGGGPVNGMIRQPARIRIRGRVGGGFGGGGFAGGQFNGDAGLRTAAIDPRFDFHVDTYQQRFQTLRLAVIQEMMRSYSKIADALQRFYREETNYPTADEMLMTLVKKGYLKESDLKDRWGHFYKTHADANVKPRWFTLTSAGPDGRFDTSDDITVPNDSYYGRNRTMLQAGRAMVRGGFGGGGFGGFAGGGAMAAAPEGDRDAAKNGLMVFDAPVELALAKGARGAAAPAGSEAGPRVREYFPETLYWNPALITDERGQAEIKLPLADSITTWRVSMTANSEAGQLGSATAPIKVYQDFFADIDLPVALTQNDRMELPVTVYNYLPTSQTVTLTLQKEPWFTLTGSATQTVQVASNQVKVVYYPIMAAAIGHHSLTVTAKGSSLSDAVRRAIEVLPDGKEYRTAINDRLEGTVEKTVAFPANAVPGSEAIWVKLYPGTFSQVVEGLDGILQMPNGCFEQTSSTTYPDVLVLDYLKQTRRINPEIQMKAEQYINVGYQRLVTFECKNGGFSWFGNEPAHQILTAYGLLEFSDMAKVHEVDPNVIARTQRWLASKQQVDGSWEEKGQGIAEGIINRQTGALRSTAYIAWALAESGDKGPELTRAVAYVRAHQHEAKDPYTLAVILNLLARVDRDGELTAQTAELLIGKAKINEKAAWWQSDTQTFTGADHEGADLETTGLAAYGLAKWGRNAGFTNKVLTDLVQSKNSYGTWNTTQGTVWAMKALLYASGNGAGGNKGTVTLLANGKPVGTYKITPEDSDVMRQVDLKASVRPGSNAITLKYEGEGSPLYQIVGRYYVPWQQVAIPELAQEGPISLDVSYDKTKLAQDDTATVTVKIHNHSERVAEMPLIDLGIPPGFTVIPDNLDAAVQAKTISKYTVAARQVIVYMDELAGGKTVTLTYQVRAKFPIKARTPLSKVYPYYNPERVAFSVPQDILVQK